MRERIGTFALVTLVSVVIWLYAEAETRDTVDLPARVQFVNSQSWWVRVADADWDRTPTVEMQGSRATLSVARDVLAQPLIFTPGDAGVPTREGRITVELTDVLREHPDLKATNVSVTSVRPTTVELQIEEFIEIELPVQASLPSVRTIGPIVVEPPSVPLRIRTGLAEQLPAGATLTAIANLETLPTSGEVIAAGVITLDEAFSGSAQIESDDRVVEIRFTVETLTIEESVRAPVWVMTPSNEAQSGEWIVTLNETDRFLAVQITGPQDLVRRYLPGGTDAIIGALTLTSNDLQAGQGEKRVTLMTRSGSPIPPEVDVELTDEFVGYAAARREPEPSE
ncbi:MAG: hypothetical protein AAGB34_05205 [Planctomycetota bacterium]